MEAVKARGGRKKSRAGQRRPGRFHLTDLHGRKRTVIGRKKCIFGLRSHCIFGLHSPDGLCFAVPGLPWEREACKGGLPSVFGPKYMTGKEFKAIRTSFGLTQEQLAEVLDVTRLTIINSERRGPSKAVLSYLQVALAKGRLQISEKKEKPEGES